MEKIGSLMHREFKEQPKEEKRDLCRFDLVVRWPEYSKRKINPFAYRGDHYEKDPQKMLWSLLRFFISAHHNWLFCQIRDNTKPSNDESRIIFHFKHNQGIITNRLSEYNEMLKDHPVPEWLKPNV